MGELSQPNLSVRPTPSKLHNLGIHKEQEKCSTGVLIGGGLAGSCPLGWIWPAQSSPIPAPAILGNNKLKN